MPFSYLLLFWEFFKTGLFTVGGGLAALPFLYDISNRTGWYTHAQLIDMIAVSESTPGPIGVNMATYVGFTLAGVPGSVLATFALVLPTVIIAYFVARALNRFRQNPLVNAAFYGLRPAVCGLIANACWGIIKVSMLTLRPPGFGISSTSRLLSSFLWPFSSSASTKNCTPSYSLPVALSSALPLAH